jgi:hypothetical protein
MVLYTYPIKVSYPTAKPKGVIPMPGKDFSSEIGSSPSPAIERVIENNKNVQQPFSSPQEAIAGAFNKHPVTDLSKKQ